jgi:hypothetical protein
VEYNIRKWNNAKKIKKVMILIKNGQSKKDVIAEV